MRVEIALAAAELRHRPAVWLLLALGTCLAGLLPVYAAGLAGDASRAATTAAVDSLPVPQRAVLAITTRVVAGPELEAADRQVQASYAAIGVTQPARSLTFRPLSLAGQDVALAALSPLATSVRLTSGRLPARCPATSCEVLAITPGTAGTAAAATVDPAAARQLGVVVTGTAVLTDSRLTGLGLAEPGLPLLLGADPGQLAGLTSLELFGRNTAWFAQLDGARTAALGPSQVGRVLDGLPEAVGDAGPLSVSWPEAEVRAAAARADQASTRLRALGRGAGLLTLIFCVVAAAALRPRTQHLARLLTRRGARTSQVLLVLVLQAATVVVTGLVVGAGATVLWWGARPEGETPWEAALKAATASVPTLLALAVAAVLLTVLVTRWPSDAAPLATWFLGGALAVAVGLPVLVLTSGTSATDGGLPAQLVLSLVLATGLLTALVWRPLAGLTRPRVQRRRTPVDPGADGQAAAVRRVAVLGARRRPLLPLTAAGLLAATSCFGVFTAGYRQSLHTSAGDQAAAAVPLDVSVRGTGAVPAPQDAVDVPALLALSPQVAVHPLVTAPVTVFAGTEHAVTLPLTGIDLDALPAVNRFAATTGAGVSATDLAARLTPAAAAPAAPPVLPSDGRRVTFTVLGVNADITVALWTSRPDGREERVVLRRSGSQLIGVLPAGSDRQVRALEVAESDVHLVRRQHGVGEGTTDRALAGGTLRFTRVAVDGTPLDWSWSAWGSDTATLHRTADRLDVDYRLNGTRVVLDPAYVPRAALRPVPVAVDPVTAATAGPTGRLSLSVRDQPVPAQVVAVLPRLPGVSGPFVLAARDQVAQLLDRSAPGTAVVSQLWVTVPATSLPAVRNALEPAVAAGVDVAYRTDLAAAIAADPVSSRTTGFLTVVGVGTLLLTLVALLTAVRADQERVAADQLALELDGVRPARLRTVLRLRASLLLVAVPLGMAGGLVVEWVAVQLLTLGPGGVPVEPPLRVTLPSLAGVAGVVGALLLAVLAVLALTATAYRQPRPVAPDTDLR
ncbi:hypothetical protein [uncultured Friedmanniella sp.]|uniref:hypothetical protein n=1 Tax=uncultured Friedmanniella sp. TaxID=335381 RepID=UPI0035CA6D0F